MNHPRNRGLHHPVLHQMIRERNRIDDPDLLFVFRLENHMLLQKGGGIQGAPKPEGWHGILVLGSY